MKKTLKVPTLNNSDKAGVFVAWLKEEGDLVEVGEPIYEVETDKVVRQVEAEEAGRLGEQLVEEGDEVTEGQEVATLDLEG